MKRFLDFIFSFLGLVALAIPVAMVGLMVKCISPAPILYWSDRVGKDNILFKMLKFRSMKMNTPQVATHLLTHPDRFLTAIGKILRKTSLDELPQLVNILKGDMSFVGPRPALFNQEDLIALRTQKGVHRLVPGLTGWAQVNGRDELSIPVKVEFDEYYLKNKSFFLDLKILFLTVFVVLKSQGIDH